MAGEVEAVCFVRARPFADWDDDFPSPTLPAAKRGREPDKSWMEALRRAAGARGRGTWIGTSEAGQPEDTRA